MFCQSILRHLSKKTGPDKRRIWKSPITLILALILALFCFKSAAAQEVNLEKALELFYKNNYDIIINRYEIDKARGDYVAAESSRTQIFQ